MAGRTGVRATLYNFLTTPPITNLNQVFTSFPKRINFQQGASAGQMSRGAVVIFIQSENETESILNTIISCIDYIYDKETLYYAKDSTKEELSEFVESLQTKDLQKFKEFFDTTPKLRKNINFKCPKCSYEENVLVEGIESFFV